MTSAKTTQHLTTQPTVQPRDLRRRTGLRRLTGALLPLVLVTACGAGETDERDDAKAPKDDTERVSSDAGTEAASITPRALVAHDGTLTLLDTETGKTLTSSTTRGFVRLSDGGDGRHVVVADGDRFTVFDTGIATQAHGDHDHHRTWTPRMTDAIRRAPEAGHAVPHGGWTALFSDGTGEVELLRTADLSDPEASTTTTSTGAAHHGVAVRLADGSLLHTVGTADERRSAVLTRDGKTLARTDDCPGVHGEATAAPDTDGDVLALGCENGPVVLRNGAFHKVTVKDEYARTGNLAGHPHSPFVLTDYKTDADAELERPTRIGLLDTRDATLRTVDLESSYWFRSLGRGPGGEAVVLTYDGSLRVVDPVTGRQTAAIDAIEAWTEKDDWQEPGPVLEVVGERAYVSDPAARELVVVDLSTRSVVARHPLPAGVTELVVTDGVAPEHTPGPEDEDGHSHDRDGDDHEGHSH